MNLQDRLHEHLEGACLIAAGICRGTEVPGLAECRCNSLWLELRCIRLLCHIAAQHGWDADIPDMPDDSILGNDE